MAENKETQTTDKTPEGGSESGAKKKKIKDLTLKEIEAKLAECRDKQGGLTSRYSKQLLLRKKALTS